MTKENDDLRDDLPIIDYWVSLLNAEIERWQDFMLQFTSAALIYVSIVVVGVGIILKEGEDFGLLLFIPILIVYTVILMISVHVGYGGVRTIKSFDERIKTLEDIRNLVILKKPFDPKKIEEE